MALSGPLRGPAAARRPGAGGASGAWRATAVASLACLAACRGGPAPLVVGSKNFTEQDLLGEIVAQWVDARTDIPVRRRLHLGGTFIAHRALVAGELDLYVEYTGTAYTAVLERPPIHDRDSVYREVASAYRSRWDLEWLPPLGFENTFAILVRRGMADSLHLSKLSDLAAQAADLTAGFGYEFMQREDGFRGLSDRYGLEFAGPPREMDLGLIYRALADRRIDVTAGNSTDGRIESLDLRVLEDDLGYFPPYQAAIVARSDPLREHPVLRTALVELSGRLDTRTMRRLNAAVDVDGRDVAAVAGEWVRRELAAVDDTAAISP